MQRPQAEAKGGAGLKLKPRGMQASSQRGGGGPYISKGGGRGASISAYLEGRLGGTKSPAALKAAADWSTPRLWLEERTAMGANSMPALVLLTASQTP